VNPRSRSFLRISGVERPMQLLAATPEALKSGGFCCQAPPDPA
jgi:hypothetical protein